MAFGVKTKNIKTQNPYTIESFFDAIKDKEFTAGTPSLTKHGMATVITFPALDSQNQVWIMKSGFGKETQKFSIQKSTQAGMDNVAKMRHWIQSQAGFSALAEWSAKTQKSVKNLLMQPQKNFQK